MKKRFIGKPDFLLDRELRIVFDVFGRDKVYVVGGAVRDYLLDALVGDIDLSIRMNMKNIIERVEGNPELSVLDDKGIQFGSIVVGVGDKAFQATCFRKDIKTDGRYAKIEFTEDIKEDAKRRDFTINTLYMDCEGNILDPLGLGLKDVDEKVIRFIGRPDKRIKEDFLRILRLFKLMATHEGLKPEKEALESCVRNKDLLNEISKTRLNKELAEIRKKVNGDNAIKLMEKHKIIIDASV